MFLYHPICLVAYQIISMIKTEKESVTLLMTAIGAKALII